jgi:photosystem II stability/assembly factor-like uncharacterized protein
VAVPDASHAFVSLSLQQGLGLPGPGVLLASSDGGRTWSRRILPGSGQIEFATASRGWLAGVDGGVYATRDGGGTWRAVSVSAPPGFGSPAPLAELPTFSDPTHAVLPVTFRRGARTAVSFLTTSNAGTTWQSAAVVTGRGAAASAVVDATGRMALLDGGRRVVRITNGKPERTAATSGLPLASPGFELESVSFASISTGWATVSTTHGETLYRTVDGGVTWAPLSPPALHS